MGPQLDKAAGTNGARMRTGICRRAGKGINIQLKRALVGLCRAGMAKGDALCIVHRAQRARGRRAQAVEYAPDLAGPGVRTAARLGLHTHNLAAAQSGKLANIAATKAVHYHSGQQGQTAAASSQHKGVVASDTPQI